jgi:hypothetical protein
MATEEATEVAVVAVDAAAVVVVVLSVAGAVGEAVLLSSSNRKDSNPRLRKLWRGNWPGPICVVDHVPSCQVNFLFCNSLSDLYQYGWRLFFAITSHGRIAMG